MIDFNNVPKVDLEFMNSDHKVATEITNRLMAEIDQGSPNKEKVSIELDALLQHCQEHFAREERQMMHFNFPPYPVHKGEHERVLAEMNAELVAWCETYDVERMKQYLFATLTNWFIDHIATMDTITARFIANSGGPLDD